MSSWSNPAPIAAQDTFTQTSPVLLTFAGEVWCFWVKGSDNCIEFATTTRTGWSAPGVIDSTARDPDTGNVTGSSGKRYSVKPVGPDEQPMIAAVSAGPLIHLLFTDHTKDGASCARHVIYNANLKTWATPIKPPDGLGAPAERSATTEEALNPLASGITAGLGLLCHDNELYATWLNAEGKRVGATYGKDYSWTEILKPNSGPTTPGTAMASLSERTSIHILTFTSDPVAKVIDIVIDTRKLDVLPTAVVRQDAIPEDHSTSSLSACNFQELVFYALHNPKTGSFKIFEFKDVDKSKEHPGPSTDASSPVVPAIEVAKNSLYCVWQDTKTKQLLYSVEPYLAFKGTMARWMSAYTDDSTPISRLTIPGTHDSGAISRIPFVGCQMTTIRQQLDNGIRFFDLRAGYGFRGNFTYPVIHHARVRIVAQTEGSSAWDVPSWFDAVKVEDVFRTFYQFLNDNPGEGLIVQIKRDELDIENKLHDDDVLKKFADDIWNIRQRPEAAGKWILASDQVPTVGQLRGKIQLIRRFVDGLVPPDQRHPARQASYGIPVLLQWVDKAEDDELRPTKGVRIRLQDYFDLGWETAGWDPTAAKWKVVQRMLDKAFADRQESQDQPAAWFINFASGVQVPRLSLGSLMGAVVSVIKGQAHSVATGFWYNNWLPLVDPYGVNANLLNYFNQPDRPKGGYGTIVMDFPEQPADLIAAMVRTNFPT